MPNYSYTFTNKDGGITEVVHTPSKCIELAQQGAHARGLQYPSDEIALKAFIEVQGAIPSDLTPGIYKHSLNQVTKLADLAES